MPLSPLSSRNSEMTKSSSESFGIDQEGSTARTEASASDPIPLELMRKRVKGIPEGEIVMLHEGIMDRFNEVFASLADPPAPKTTPDDA